MKKLMIFTLVLSFAVLCLPLSAQDISKAPVEFQAAILSKAFKFDKALKGDINVYVINSNEFAAEFKKLVGKTFGAAKISGVTSGSSLPDSKPDVIFAGANSDIPNIIKYTKENKVLSITGIPEYVPQGISLGVGLVGGKPKILLNISNSVNEGRDWSQAIFKIGKTYK